MSWLNPKTLMLIFGFATIGALAVFLILFEGSPAPLSASHAHAIPGSFILSCKKCHTKQGLMKGCLDCHEEIARQIDGEKGYHAYLLQKESYTCEQCHTEHHGEDFPLVSALAWQDQNTNTFDHPHTDFNLSGNHDKLGCDESHKKKLTKPFMLPDFPDQQRTSTMLGLEQDCISCHDDVHKSGDLTSDCTRCHDQNAFKPAPHFQHDKYYMLEGVHPTAACSACHQTEKAGLTVNEDLMPFGPVKGKACADCHESPHRFETTLRDCQSCHFAADEKWALGRRGIDPQLHATFGFALTPPHADRDCEKCHQPEFLYAERYPDPARLGYMRRPDQCRGCHADPHAGQFVEKHPACLECHRKDRFIPSEIGPGQHSKTYPLQGAHQAVACIQCHTVDPATEVRQFTVTPTACKDCHTDPHKEQFHASLLEGDCSACHLSDSSTFRIQTYQHRNQTAFFLGKDHQQAACQKCHTSENGAEVVVYQSAPTTCAECHSDVHRGQFLKNGTTECERCHGTTEKWTAKSFVHDRDARFSLAGAHAKVACAACHLPVQQPDGKPVVQYQPLTTRCEDCHGFITK